ncbi:hypothetical protein M408DRAFT_195978 [Serendipita vermifera MAFF 305830]|uniref:F-box domain-containing protein n=1 Tax=Serendipita vermifera MAFF 305830 TaxID=933852 RepID=A0A0C2XAX8_SERVB|nr:hypothetical protein M408DRAFT_195978 [Serendipita vermifera MAFF 305830]
MIISALPAEVWLIILEHAMFGSILTVYPATNAVEHPTAIHDWLKLPVEKNAIPHQWAIMRLVSRFWKSFVDRQKPRYRFVRLRDLSPTMSANKPDKNTLQRVLKSQRIQGLSLWSLANMDMTVNREPSIVKPLLASLPRGAIFHASIITDIGYDFSRLIVGPHAERFPYLRCLTIDVYRLLLNKLFPALSLNFPFLTFLSLYSNIVWVTPRYPPPDGLIDGSQISNATAHPPKPPR